MATPIVAALEARGCDMPRVLQKGEEKIGAFLFPDRKKPSLCYQKGGRIIVYGTFNSIESAEIFMDELADFVGAVKGEE